MKLRFFAGVTAEQAAAALGASLFTAEKGWSYARSRLRVAIDRVSPAVPFHAPDSLPVPVSLAWDME